MVVLNTYISYDNDMGVIRDALGLAFLIRIGNRQSDTKTRIYSTAKPAY